MKRQEIKVGDRLYHGCRNDDDALCIENVTVLEIKKKGWKLVRSESGDELKLQMSQGWFLTELEAAFDLVKAYCHAVSGSLMFRKDPNPQKIPRLEEALALYREKANRDHPLGTVEFWDGI